MEEAEALSNISNKKGIIGALAQFALVWLVTITIINNLPSVPPQVCKWTIFLLEAVIVAHHFLRKNRLPRTRSKKIGIVFCIKAQPGEKQQVKSFINTFKTTLIERGLGGEIEILTIPEQRHQQFIDVLDEWRSMKIEMRRNPSTEPMGVRDASRRLNKFHSKVRGHIYIWGSLEKRKSGEEIYNFSLNSLVLHARLQDPLLTEVGNEVSGSWIENLSFPANFEFEHMGVASDTYLGCVEFILGIAALVSHKPEIALRLHEDLLSRATGLRNLPISEINLKEKVMTELNILAHLNAMRDEFGKAHLYLDRALAYDPSHYPTLLLRGLTNFYAGKIDLAKKDIENAKSLALKNNTGDGSWRYSHAFLLAYEENYYSAAEVYKNISRRSFPGEISVAQQVVVFLENLLKRNPGQIWIDYVLGLINYKKLGNVPAAIVHLDKYLIESAEVGGQEPFRMRARSFLAEIRDRFPEMAGG